MSAERCPNCGYCQHCGRSDAPQFVPAPWPVFPAYPTYPTWAPWESDPFTFRIVDSTGSNQQ